METTILNPEALKAALFSASKKDVRYYLNGVCVQFKTGVPFAFAFGSDGHRVGCFRVKINDDTVITENSEVIIPYNVVKDIKKQTTLVLRKINDDQWQLGDTLFKPVNGRYPDIARVIPKNFDDAKTAVNPEYLLDAYKAMCIYRGRSDYSLFEVNQNKESGNVVVHDGHSDAFVVIMGMRVDKKTFQGLPAEYR